MKKYLISLIFLFITLFPNLVNSQTYRETLSPFTQLEYDYYKNFKDTEYSIKIADETGNLASVNEDGQLHVVMQGQVIIDNEVTV